MNAIPGFRSKKMWKMIVAGLYYLAALTSLTQGFFFFLFILLWPFVIFNAIDVINQLKNFKKAMEGPNEERKLLNEAAIKFVGVIFMFSIAIKGIPHTNSTNTEPSTTKIVAVSKSETVNKAEASTPDTVHENFSTMELNENSVKNALKGIIEDGKLKKVEITQEKGKNIVDIFYDPGTVWDEKDLVNQTARQAVASMEIMFTNPKVDKVWFWTQTVMTDAKGNDSEQNVVNVSLAKENAKDINWPKFKSMVLVDYKKLFAIADSTFIHPSIKTKLN